MPTKYEIIQDELNRRISRIDNALDSIENNLIKTRAQLDTINAEFETAKASLGSPFPQEEELQTKLKRLAELDILLNIDGNGETQEQPEQGEKPEQTVEAADKKPGMPVIGEKQESADIATDRSICNSDPIIQNYSINELYKTELQNILGSVDFAEAESKVIKIPRKQKDNKYTTMYLPVEEYNCGVRGGAFAAIPLCLSRVHYDTTNVFARRRA